MLCNFGYQSTTGRFLYDKETKHLLKNVIIILNLSLCNFSFFEQKLIKTVKSPAKLSF